MKTGQRPGEDLLTALKNAPGEAPAAALYLGQQGAGGPPPVLPEPGSVQIEIEATAEQGAELVGVPEAFAPPQPAVEGKRLVMEVFHPLAPVVKRVHRRLSAGAFPRLLRAAAGFLVALGHLLTTEPAQIQRPHLTSERPDQPQRGDGGGGKSAARAGRQAQLSGQRDEDILIPLRGHRGLELAQGGAQCLELGRVRPGRHQTQQGLQFL